MDFDISMGKVAVPAPLEFCVVWLDSTDWDRIPIGRQKQIYAFFERVYKTRSLFYCKGSVDIYNLISIKAPSVGAHTRVSESTLRKVFDKYIGPKLNTRNFTHSDIHVPDL